MAAVRTAFIVVVRSNFTGMFSNCYLFRSDRMPKGKKTKQPLPLPSVQELTPYELERERNILRIKQSLAALQTKEAIENLHQARGHRPNQPQPKPQPKPQKDRIRSSTRLQEQRQGLLLPEEEEDEEDPDYRQEEDEEEEEFGSDLEEEDLDTNLPANMETISPQGQQKPDCEPDDDGRYLYSFLRKNHMRLKAFIAHECLLPVPS